MFFGNAYSWGGGGGGVEDLIPRNEVVIIDIYNDLKSYLRHHLVDSTNIDFRANNFFCWSNYLIQHQMNMETISAQ